ncbi:uncharacterized protein LOC111540187 [Piliocolobus tephrosceles]|uniref:Uncharacterized protein n=3 Tax=Colobinae TaxID=9569 RepID=A0A2K6KMN8_RHIBE|nr:uncharacterized protein LOC104665557 [Rhinopithecus roxellana]XP_023064085.1 uncharacterized protein LOC111540187 [Piliocolobus tephrosceles]
MRNTVLSGSNIIAFSIKAAWRKDGSFRASLCSPPQELLDEGHLFPLSCSPLPAPNGTWVPRLVLGLGSGDQVHYLPISSSIVNYGISVSGKSWIFLVYPLHPTPIWSTRCFQEVQLLKLMLVNKPGQVRQEK